MQTVDPGLLTLDERKRRLSTCSLDSRHPINGSQHIQRPVVSTPHPESLTMCPLLPDLCDG